MENSKLILASLNTQARPWGTWPSPLPQTMICLAGGRGGVQIMSHLTLPLPQTGVGQQGAVVNIAS